MENEFYKQLKAFLKELIQVFPEDEQIKIVSTKINMSMLEKDNKLINKFYVSLRNLEPIMDSDEFFSIDPKEYWTNGSNEFILFTKIVSFWHQVSESNKQVIKDYIKVIYQIAKKCSA
jgi:hypothetical protein